MRSLSAPPASTEPSGRADHTSAERKHLSPTQQGGGTARSTGPAAAARSVHVSRWLRPSPSWFSPAARGDTAAADRNRSPLLRQWSQQPRVADAAGMSKRGTCRDPDLDSLGRDGKGRRCQPRCCCRECGARQLRRCGYHCAHRVHKGTAKGSTYRFTGLYCSGSTATLQHPRGPVICGQRPHRRLCPGAG